MARALGPGVRRFEVFVDRLGLVERELAVDERRDAADRLDRQVGVGPPLVALEVGRRDLQPLSIRAARTRRQMVEIGFESGFTGTISSWGP